jgi:hypothetical protein
MWLSSVRPPASLHASLEFFTTKSRHSGFTRQPQAQGAARRISDRLLPPGEHSSESASLANPLEGHLRQKVLRRSRSSAGRHEPCEPLSPLDSLAAKRTNVPIELALLQAISALAEGLFQRRHIHVHATPIELHSPLLDVRVEQPVSELRAGQHIGSVSRSVPLRGMRPTPSPRGPDRPFRAIAEAEPVSGNAARNRRRAGCAR